MSWLFFEIESSIKKNLAKFDEKFEVIIPKEEFGDFSTNLAFILAKKLKKSPSEIVKEISRKIEKPEFVEKIEEKSGYINFFLNWEEISKKLLKEILEAGNFYGKPYVERKRIIVEHTSVNPNKALHIGHIRNACLGDSLARFLSWIGNEVIVINYINDAGSQMADLIVGFKILGFPLEKEGMKFDHYCGNEIYVKVNKLYEEKPELLEEKKKIIKEIERKDSEIAKFNREIASKVIKEQLKTLWNLGIFYDLLVRETDIIYSKFWEKVFEWLKQKNFVYLAESGSKSGCWLLKLSDLPEFKGLKDADKILVRSDGTKVYAASDIAFALWKHGLIDFDFGYRKFVKQPNGKILWETCTNGLEKHPIFNKAEISVNVIDVRQKYEQEVVSTALKLIGKKAKYIHYAYEVVSLSKKTAKELGIETDKEFVHMSGRKGIFVNADDLFNALFKKAREETRKRNPEESEEFIEKVAKALAISSIRYEMLKISPERLLIFDMDKALELKGNTAPYLQYAYTRICSVFRKAGKFEREFEAEKLEEEEKKILRLLFQFPWLIKKCYEELKLHYLCEYLFKLATIFNEFYEKHPIIKSEEKIRNFRLTLLECIKNVFEIGFDLIGIEKLGRM